MRLISRGCENNFGRTKPLLIRFIISMQFPIQFHYNFLRMIFTKSKFLLALFFPLISLDSLIFSPLHPEMACLNDRIRNWKTIKNIIFKLMLFCYRLVVLSFNSVRDEWEIKLEEFDFCKINTRSGMLGRTIQWINTRLKLKALKTAVESRLETFLLYKIFRVWVER